MESIKGVAMMILIARDYRPSAKISAALLGIMWLNISVAAKEPVFVETNDKKAARMQAFRRHIKSLHQEPNMPFFPRHPKRTFECGQMLTPSRGQGNAYSLSYKIADKVENIMNWYKAQFQGSGWSVESKCLSEYQKTRTFLSGTQDQSGAHCTVAAFPDPLNSNQAEVHIRYSSLQPKLDSAITNRPAGASRKNREKVDSK